MHYELTIKAGEHDRKAFLQDGFYTDVAPSAHLHKHTYTEIHLITGGSATFDLGGSTLRADGDTMLVIPAERFHSCTQIEPTALHSAFQIDLPITEIKDIRISAGIIPSFLEEIKKSSVTNDYAAICAYISLFCSFFYTSEKISAKKVSDQSFIIYEFFSNQYNSNVSLGDLARLLCLSERQTERQVLRHTGMTFNEKLTETRMAMARQLRDTSDMTLKEISEYLGYRSYSGFWKAMKKVKS